MVSRKRPSISITLSALILEKVDEYCKRRGLTRSMGIERLIVKGLAVEREAEREERGEESIEERYWRRVMQNDALWTPV